MPAVTLNRVAVYVDGFNLYFGMKAARLSRFYWLDVAGLAQKLLKPGQDLVSVKYFTARTSGPLPLDTAAEAQERTAKLARQGIYLRALSIVGGVKIFEGHYSSTPKYCRQCEAPYYRHEEKLTDVNIATELLVDAYENRFDIALIITADSDLVPPVRAIRSLFHAAKFVVAVFPPKRKSKRLAAECNAWFHINENLLRACQLPDPILVHGKEICRPAEWE